MIQYISSLHPGKPSTTSSCPMVLVPIDPQGSRCLLPTTAVSDLSGHRCGRAWKWSIGSISSPVTCSDSNFTWYMAGFSYVVYLVSASSKGTKLKGSKLVVVRYTSGKLFTVVPNRLLCSPIHTSLVSSTWPFLRNTLVPFARQHVGDNYRYPDDNTTPCSGSPWFPTAGQHQDRAACSIASPQTHRTWIGLCNPQYGQAVHNIGSPTKPCWMNWQKSL